MLIDNIFKKYDIKPNGIIHIGAHECEEYDIYKSQAMCDNIIWIEANPEVVSKITRHKVYQACISDKSGDIVDFIITNNMQSSSFLDLKEHLVEHPNVFEQKRIKLETITLKDFVNKYSINCNDYDFLVMDIQGAELHALRGMPDLIDNFKYIYIEVNTKELYKGCGLFNEIVDFLKNFKLLDLKLTQHGWGDALFIKEKNIYSI